MVDRSNPAGQPGERFARPWRVEAAADRYLVKDASGVLLAAISFSSDGVGLPSDAEARAMADRMVAAAGVLMSAGDLVGRS